MGSIITERNIRLAAVDPKVQSEFQRYKTVNKADRRRIVQDILSGPYVDADKDWFIEQVEMRANWNRPSQRATSCFVMEQAEVWANWNLGPMGRARLKVIEQVEIRANSNASLRLSPIANVIEQVEMRAN